MSWSSAWASTAADPDARQQTFDTHSTIKRSGKDQSTNYTDYTNRKDQSTNYTDYTNRKDQSTNYTDYTNRKDQSTDYTDYYGLPPDQSAVGG